MHLCCTMQNGYWTHFCRPQTKFGARSCFYTCLSFLFTGGCLSLGPGVTPLNTPPGHTAPEHTPLDTPRTHTHTLDTHPRVRWPLKRAVRILLECILVVTAIAIPCTLVRVNGKTIATNLCRTRNHNKNVPRISSVNRS